MEGDILNHAGCALLAQTAHHREDARTHSPILRAFRLVIGKVDTRNGIELFELCRNFLDLIVKGDHLAIFNLYKQCRQSNARLIARSGQ